MLDLLSYIINILTIISYITIFIYIDINIGINKYLYIMYSILGILIITPLIIRIIDFFYVRNLDDEYYIQLNI